MPSTHEAVGYYSVRTNNIYAAKLAFFDDCLIRDYNGIFFLPVGIFTRAYSPVRNEGHLRFIFARNVLLERGSIERDNLGDCSF